MSFDSPFPLRELTSTGLLLGNSRKRRALVRRDNLLHNGKSQATAPAFVVLNNAAALGDLGEVSSELVFFDDEKPIFIRLNQSEVMKSLHKQAGPRPRRAHHLRQLNHDPSSFR
jgi:hypothetical protein